MSSKRTLAPVVTGQSVLAVKYDGGVMVAVDTQLCYGNQRKFKDVQRLFYFDQTKTLIASSGEYSDMQNIEKILTRLDMESFEQSIYRTSLAKSPPEVAAYLARILYERRCGMDPLWLEICVSGIARNGNPYLAYVDLHGTHFEETAIATGMGRHLVLPLLRERTRNQLTESEARQLLLEGMKILYTNDCLGFYKVQIGTITAAGVSIETPVTVEGNWFDNSLHPLSRNAGPSNFAF